MKRSLVLATIGALFILLSANLQAQSGVPTVRDLASERSQGIDEKRNRTAAQQKIDSQLLQAARLKRSGLATSEIGLQRDSTGRVAVDLSAQVTDDLLKAIGRENGEVISSYPQFNTVRAYLTLESLESIANLSEVRFISRAAAAQTSTDSKIQTEPARAGTSEPQPGVEKAKSSTTKKRRKNRRHNRRYRQL